MNMYNLFVAGAETTSSTITWAFVYLSVYPEVQEKLYQEIRKVVGISNFPTLDARAK